MSSPGLPVNMPSVIEIPTTLNSENKESKNLKKLQGMSALAFLVLINVKNKHKLPPKFVDMAADRMIAALELFDKANGQDWEMLAQAGDLITEHGFTAKQVLKVSEKPFSSRYTSIASYYKLMRCKVITPANFKQIMEKWWMRIPNCAVPLLQRGWIKMDEVSKYKEKLKEFDEIGRKLNPNTEQEEPVESFCKQGEKLIAAKVVKSHEELLKMSKSELLKLMDKPENKTKFILHAYTIEGRREALEQQGIITKDEKLTDDELRRLDNVRALIPNIISKEKALKDYNEKQISNLCDTQTAILKGLFSVEIALEMSREEAYNLRFDGWHETGHDYRKVIKMDNALTDAIDDLKLLILHGKLPKDEVPHLSKDDVSDLNRCTEIILKNKLSIKEFSNLKEEQKSHVRALRSLIKDDLLSVELAKDAKKDEMYILFHFVHNSLPDILEKMSKEAVAETAADMKDNTSLSSDAVSSLTFSM